MNLKAGFLHVLSCQMVPELFNFTLPYDDVVLSVRNLNYYNLFRPFAAVLK